MVIRKKKATAKKAKKVNRKKVATNDSAYFNQLCTTPKGILSYPTVSTPTITQDGREQYSCDIYVSKEEMLTEKGQKFMATIEAALDFYELDMDELEFPPIVDMDETENPAEHEVGCYRIRAKNKLAVPSLINRKKEELDEDEIKAIKGGDIGKLLVSPYKYTFQKSEGLGLGFEALMFIDEGEPLGGGAMVRVSAIAEMDDEELEDGEFEEEVESEEDDTEFDD